MRRLRSYLNGTMLGARVAQAGRASFIKAIYRGELTIATGDTTGTATITAVDPANTLVFYNGSRSDNGVDSFEKASCYLELTNATTLTGTRSTSSEIQRLYYEVVEYWPGVLKSVKRNTIALTGVASNTDTITAVDTTKALCTSLGYSTTNTDGASVVLTRVTLTNATTVTASRTTGTGNNVASYQVAEFY